MILSKNQRLYQMALLCLLIFMPVRSSHAQADYANYPVTLKSLQITQIIDLNKLFRPSIETAIHHDNDVSTFKHRELHSLELVGTLILGEEKFAWIKIDNFVYQLESGEMLPGMQEHVSKINPDTVILKNDETCNNSTQCEKTLSIRDTLF